MTEQAIRYQRIKIAELVEFAERVITNTRPGQFVPITRQRAIAHAHNPYADPDDIGLLVAVDEEDEVVGYFGIMPVLLRVGEQLHKCHWFTTWSVSAKVRGRGVGSGLMREALRLKNDYLIVGSVHARRVCQKFGFWEREPLPYYWLDVSGMGALNPLTGLLRLLRKTFHLLRVGKTVSVTNPATRFVDRILSPGTRLVFYALLRRLEASQGRDFRFQEVSQLRPEAVNCPAQPEIELHRGVEAVNWMLQHPWVVPEGQSPTEDRDYYFSDTRPMFKFIATEIFAPGSDEYWGYAVFSISQKEQGVFLKILDFRLKDLAMYPFVLALALRYGRHYRATWIEMPAEVSAPLQGSLLGRLLLREKKRIYQCLPKNEHSPLAKAWPHITLHLYDGDMAFS